MNVQQYYKGDDDDLGIDGENIDTDNSSVRSADALSGLPDLNDISRWITGETGLKSGDMVLETSLEYPHEFSEELDDSQNSVIQFAQGRIKRKRRGGTLKVEETQYITHEDFEEGAERDAFLMIYGYAENLFESNDKAKQDQALDFFFCNHPHKLTFKDAAACISQTIRVDVVRLRLMFEFWVREWHFDNLPFEMDVIPDRVQLMAAMHGDIEGAILARNTWYEPGIEIDDLIEMSSDEEDTETYNNMVYALECLSKNHVISISNGRAYLTGKNPILEIEDRLKEAPDFEMRNKRIAAIKKLHWSRIF